MTSWYHNWNVLTARKAKATIALFKIGTVDQINAVKSLVRSLQNIYSARCNLTESLKVTSIAIWIPSFSKFGENNFNQIHS